MPNVKLRPAAKAAEVRAPAPLVEDGVSAAELAQNCKKPLQGVVICASGLVDKVRVLKIGHGMSLTALPTFTDVAFRPGR